MPNEIRSSRHSAKCVRPPDDKAEKTRLANATQRNATCKCLLTTSSRALQRNRVIEASGKRRSETGNSTWSAIDLDFHDELFFNLRLMVELLAFTSKKQLVHTEVTMMNVKDNVWGQITVERDVVFPPLLDAARDLSWETTDVYRWHPRIELADKVPNGFGFALQCLTDVNDNRVFLPIGLEEKGHDDYLAFFTAAWNAGFSILCQTDRMDESYRFSFRLMWFLFQRVRKMQQFVRRGFKTKKDLLVAISVRSEVGEDHVLPWDVEATTIDQKCPVAVEQLIEAGNRAALEFGIQHPTTADQIHFGLAAAARRAPSHPMSPEQAAKVIRYSLFDVEPDPADLTNEIRQVIEEAVLETIEPFVMNEDMPYQVFGRMYRNPTKDQGNRFVNFQNRLELVEPLLEYWHTMSPGTLERSSR